MGRMEQMLRQLQSERGSDLHLAAGQPPRMRRKGTLAPIEGEAPAHQRRAARAAPRDHERRAVGELRGAERPRLQRPWPAGRRALPRQLLRAGERLGGGVPHHSRGRSRRSRTSALPPGDPRVRGTSTAASCWSPGRRARASRRSLAAAVDHIDLDALRQAHPRRRGSRRVRAPESRRWRWSRIARSARTRADFGARPARGPARGLRRGPRRRDETTTDRDLARARPPAGTGDAGVRAASHQQRRATIDRVVDAFPADEQPQVRLSLSSRSRASCRSSCCAPPTARAAARPTRS